MPAGGASAAASSPDSSRANFGPADGGASASRSGCRRSSRLRCSAHRPSSPGPWHLWKMSGSWRQTAARRGRVRVDGLADEVGWSRKRLWSRFRSQIGLTPKRAAQLVRFDHAAHLLAAGHDAASVAAQSGYVDQSHLHREVKAIAGVTPTAVATAPWLAIDDVAWPAAPRT